MDLALAQVDSTVSGLYDALDLIGVLLNGIIGGTIARQRGYDIIGFCSWRYFLRWVAE